MQKMTPQNQTSSFVSYPKKMTYFRALIYSMACDNNSKSISLQAFLAGCNRYGIDNPCPIITKRLANYGNNEDLLKQFETLVDKYKK